MDISQWGIGQIMQLPDWCFGSRWPIGLGIETSAPAAFFAISDAALPEWCVIWELRGLCEGVEDTTIEFTYALHDALPATGAIFDSGELLFPHLVTRTGRRSAIMVAGGNSDMRITMRQPVHAIGRRLCCRFQRKNLTPLGGETQIIISAVPRSVPDCLFYRT